ncbi:hypothetical protein [Bifidobacterium porcinum]|uniref:hypothetical protein n=1 Tax=Bifidobacterium porcinum TaxID=212365 RepID=UPI003995C42E
MKNFFKGISVPQLVAGALAAVTSFLLSARIGIAGSVIGVAVGSIVSAVSSQLYQNILKASSEKLQDVKGGDDEQIEGEQTDQTADADGASGETARQPRRISSDETTVLPVQGAQSAANARNIQGEGEAKPDATRAMPTVGAADATTVMQPADDATRVISGGVADDATRVISGASAAAHAHAGADGHQGRVIVSGNETGTTAARHLSGSANTERTRKTKRVAIIISVVSALVAVGITAGVIMLVTRGQGTDSVVRDMVGNARVTPTPSDSQTRRDDDHQLEKPSDKPSTTASPSPSASSSASASSTASPSPSATASASPSASASSSSSAASGSDSGSSAGSNGGGTSDSSTTDGSDSGTTGTDSDTSGTGSSSSGSTDRSGTATK